jgi:hypothetical protein
MGDGLYLSYFEVSRPLNRVLHEWAKVAHEPPLELAAALQLKGQTSHLKPDFDSVGDYAKSSSSSAARASSNRPGSASRSRPDSSSGPRPSSAVRRTTSAIHTVYTDATADSSSGPRPSSAVRRTTSAIHTVYTDATAVSSASQSSAVVPPLSTLPPRPPTPPSSNSAASALCTQLAPTPRVQLWGSSPRAWRAQLMERQAADDRDEVFNPFNAHHSSRSAVVERRSPPKSRIRPGGASANASMMLIAGRDRCVSSGRAQRAALR